MKTKNQLQELRELSSRFPMSMSNEDFERLNVIYHYAVENLEDPHAMFTYSIAKAMRKHFESKQTNEHIYLQRFEIPQIRLFELLIQQFPLANLSQNCINTLLIDAIKNHTNPVLIDIGIGTGFQVTNIIAGLKKLQDCKIQNLTIIGIEPFADALNTAEKNIFEASLNAKFKIELISKEAFIELLSISDIENLLPQSNDGIYVNASFALHHIQTAENRKSVFENLKSLKISAFALSEPNSNHFEKNYQKRFDNCINHYGTLFRIIDSLPISNHEKAALKLFFSREIDDVLGNNEDVRVEKHYATEQWVRLFEETGFKLVKKESQFEITELNGTILNTELPNRYSTEFEGEEITSLFWAI